MTTFGIGIVISVVLFSGSLVGVFAQRYFCDSQLSMIELDIIDKVRELIVGLTALTLGLLVAGAKSSYDHKVDHIHSQAANIMMLGRVLHDYGSEADQAIQDLKNGVQGEVNLLSLIEATGTKGLKSAAPTGLNKIRSSILELNGDTTKEALNKSRHSQIF
jgi:hypothetical protein